MQPTFTEIKSAAKSALKRRWPEAITAVTLLIAVILLDMLCQSVLMTVFKVETVWSLITPTTLPKYSIVASICISIFSAAFELFITLPLVLGIMRWFWLITGGSDKTLSEIFHLFSDSAEYGKTVALSLKLFLRLIIGIALCFAPFAVARLATNPEIFDLLDTAMPLWLSGMGPVVRMIEALCFILFALWSLRYGLFYAVMFSEPQASSGGIIKGSRALVKGKKLRFTGFTVSFAGWFLLGLLVLPLFFVIPYVMASYSVYGREEIRRIKNAQSYT